MPTCILLTNYKDSDSKEQGFLKSEKESLTMKEIIKHV